MTTTASAYNLPTGRRRSWRHGSGGSEFGTGPLPDVALLAEAIAARTRVLDTLAELKAAQRELPQTRAEYEDARRRALAEVTRGIGTDADIPPDRTPEFEVAKSDIDHQISTAERMLREADGAIITAAGEHAAELRETAATSTAKARSKAAKSFEKFQADFESYRDAQALEAWTASVISGHARPYAGQVQHEALGIIAATLESPQERGHDRVKVEEFIDTIGWENVLKPLQVASLFPSAWGARAIANKVDVHIDVVKAVIEDRMRARSRG